MREVEKKEEPASQQGNCATGTESNFSLALAVSLSFCLCLRMSLFLFLSLFPLLALCLCWPSDSLPLERSEDRREDPS